MKKVALSIALAILLATVSAVGIQGQDRGRRPDGPPPQGPPMGKSPLVAALDENGDGEISPQEIEKAAESLKGLDENEDGKLSEEEIRPRPAPRGDAPDGPMPPRDGDGPPRGDRGRDPGQFLERIMQADADGDGKISKEEAPERMRDNFDSIDQNSDGFLDREDLSAMAARFSGRRGSEGGPPSGLGGPGGGSPEEFVDRLFRLDADGDGKLTREELSQMGNFGGGGRGREDRPEGGDSSRPRRPQRPDGGN